MTGSRTPQRIQLRRTKGWRKPEGAVSVVRGTDWGNPYRVGQPVSITTPTSTGVEEYGYQPTVTPEIAVLLYRIWISGRLKQLIRQELAGRDLACWCPLTDTDGSPWPCHADVLLHIANTPAGAVR